MSTMWRNLLGIFQKDPLYEEALRECHGAIDHLATILNVSLARMGRLPPLSPSTGLTEAEQALQRFEQETRKKVVTHITASGPGHLVSGLVLLTTVFDIEKLAENIRQIRGIASARTDPLTFGDLEEEFSEIERNTLSLFRNMRDAFQGEDLELCHDVKARYRGGLPAACDALAGRVLAGDTPGIPIADAAAASLYVVNLKRVGQHARNLVTVVANPYQRVGTQTNPTAR